MRLHNGSPAWQAILMRHYSSTRGLGRGLCIRCRYSGRTLGRSIAEFTRKRSNFLGRIIIKSFTESGHGIQGSPRIIIIQILATNVGYFVSDAHEFFRPSAIIQ